MKLLVLLSIPVLLLTACGGPKKEAQSITLTGSSTVAPLVADAAKRYEAANPGVRIDVQTGGSSRGIADVQSGLADLGMASRALKEEESALTEHRIAMDGVCLIVHRDNPVANLSKAQAIAIYTGKIDNWSALGGADSEIVVANKAEGRATLEVFLEYTGLDSADVKADVVVGENQQAIKTVAGNAAAIGYVSIGAAASEAAAGTPIRLVASDGVEATTAAVADGSFPITRPLQIITSGTIPPAAQAFLDYLKSGQVDDLVESHLYVPLAR
ncbi:MAG: phosphate ABC transporter substrate-binding protein [Verrucomicrobiales bacterium]